MIAMETSISSASSILKTLLKRKIAIPERCENIVITTSVSLLLLFQLIIKMKIYSLIGFSRRSGAVVCFKRISIYLCEIKPEILAFICREIVHIVVATE